MRKQKTHDPSANEDESESYQNIVKPPRGNNSLKSIDQYDTNDNNYSIQNRKQTINPLDNDFTTDSKSS